MKRAPFTRFNGDDLILRDLLAADRTVLANERTFLAFIRTAITLFVAGISFVHFAEDPVVKTVGWSFMPLGVVVMVLGIRKYIQMRRTLSRIEAEEKQKKDLSGSIHDS